MVLKNASVLWYRKNVQMRIRTRFFRNSHWRDAHTQSLKNNDTPKWHIFYDYTVVFLPNEKKYRTFLWERRFGILSYWTIDTLKRGNYGPRVPGHSSKRTKNSMNYCSKFCPYVLDLKKDSVSIVLGRRKQGYILGRYIHFFVRPSLEYTRTLTGSTRQDKKSFNSTRFWKNPNHHTSSFY